MPVHPTYRQAGSEELSELFVAKILKQNFVLKIKKQV
jgi:hypothetical protein